MGRVCYKQTRAFQPSSLTVVRLLARGYNSADSVVRDGRMK